MSCVSLFFALPERQGTYQVVTEQLHDERGVLVALLGQGVELCIHGQSIVQPSTLPVQYIPAMASSNEVLAIWQALSGELRIS